MNQATRLQDELLKHINPGMHLLDLGAGYGKLSEIFLEKGLTVTAVDKDPYEGSEKRLKWVTQTVEDFIDTKQYASFDIVFMRSLLQFLDKEWVFAKLFPAVKDMLNSGGLVAIRTFSKDPEPPFEKPFASYYGLQELVLPFDTYETLFAQEVSYQGTDMRSRHRLFYISDLIARKG